MPGPVTSRFSAGTNALLAAGAGVVRDTRDVLDQLLGPAAPPARRGAAAPVPLEPRLRRLLDAIERGHGSLAELTSDPDATRQVLQDLTELELRGLVRREFGGRYVARAGGAVVSGRESRRAAPSYPERHGPPPSPPCSRSPARTPAAAPGSRPT